jgi:hypothetical protein
MRGAWPVRPRRLRSNADVIENASAGAPIDARVIENASAGAPIDAGTHRLAAAGAMNRCRRTSICCRGSDESMQAPSNLLPREPRSMHASSNTLPREPSPSRISRRTCKSVRWSAGVSPAEQVASRRRPCSSRATRDLCVQSSSRAPPPAGEDACTFSRRDASVPPAHVSREILGGGTPPSQPARTPAFRFAAGALWRRAILLKKIRS